MDKSRYVVSICRVDTNKKYYFDSYPDAMDKYRRVTKAFYGLGYKIILQEEKERERE